MLAELDQMAIAPLPALPPTTRQHVAMCIRAAQEMLPRRASDDLGGDLMIQGYHRKLQHLPKAQISYAFDRATNELDWFPTPKQLLEFASAWNRTDEPMQARWKAEAIARRERQTRHEEARERIRTEECEQDWIDALPDLTKAILEAEGLLRLDEETGSYEQRDDWRDWQRFLAQRADVADPVGAAAAAFPSKRETAEV